jgi:predicted anti-sigma-YlaC factor YlaD
LTPQQQAELDGHLEGCFECRQWEQTWQELERELRQEPQLAPLPGFTQRWQERQASEGRRRLRRQGIILFTLSIGFMLALLALLFFLIWPLVQSPQLVFWSAIYQIARWFSILGAAHTVLNRTIEAAGLVLSPLIWVFFMGVTSFLAVSWLVSYRLLTLPRRVTK